ncbi:MAG: prephenate dehydratase [Burkholderiales bacterium]|jgi:chorismate mutase/prephenate dehydratase|nr:prephenate dehydratase [Burkholderiales bacterium]
MAKPSSLSQYEESIKIHRDAIDAIDGALLRLLNERAQHALEIGRVKNEQMVWRPEREAQVLQRIIKDNTGPLDNETITYLYRQFMSACRALEKKLSVAYLGPAGTFSELAVSRQFGIFVDTISFASVEEVMRSVEKKQSDFAVVPIENSTEGAIGQTHDLMIDTTLTICAEVKLRIQQNLIAQASSLETIKKVFSHPQSLAQCAQWLSRHLPNTQCVPVASNAEAARLASEEENTAAIAGENAAARYHLSIIASHIEDMPNNTTRFWVLGRDSPVPSGRDLTSLVMSAPNQSGAMYTLLAPLAKHSVSMTRLESRPARQGLWEYYFFVDIEGHCDDAPIKVALKELKALAPFLKVLGSYPAAVSEQ